MNQRLEKLKASVFIIILALNCQQVQSLRESIPREINKKQSSLLGGKNRIDRRNAAVSFQI
jgi:hypothetical protein